MNLTMESLNIELRKLVAIKFDCRDTLIREYYSPSINISINQKQDKYKIDIYSFYSINDIDINIEMEFIGVIYLKEPYDVTIEGRDSPLIKEFIENNILPRMTEEINNILLTLSIKMNIKIKELQWRFK